MAKLSVGDTRLDSRAVEEGEVIGNKIDHRPYDDCIAKRFFGKPVKP
jgi:hypothetical protein